jgi:hypothetical protein
MMVFPWSIIFILQPVNVLLIKELLNYSYLHPSLNASHSICLVDYLNYGIYLISGVMLNHICLNIPPKKHLSEYWV